MDRGGASQIYHLKELGLEVSLKSVAQFNLWRPPLTSQKAQVAGAIVRSVFASHLKDLIEHHIETSPILVVCSHPYWLPEHKKNVVWDEFKAMHDITVTEESHSDWSNLVVLVPKANELAHFCVDFRKVSI